MALAKLWSATRVDVYQVAAMKGLAYERAVFDRSEGNWPDFAGARRHPNRHLFMTQWCHGAPGIALSRLAIMEYMDEPLLLDEVKVAIETTMAAGVAPRDHLCCGNLGRALVILEAGRRLSRPELVVSANGMAATVVRRASGASNGASLPHWGIAHPSMNPGLMQGIAGIGCALLQLARPELAPSVLLLGQAPTESSKRLLRAAPKPA
jgi:lantibiotic modifying enzyme